MPVCAVAIAPFADAQMARHADLPRQHHVVFDHGAAGDADLRGKQHALPDR